MEDIFESSFQYKLIYIISINDEKHKDLLKIGDVTVKTDKTIDELHPNCRDLNLAARERIKQYTNTAGISYNLLHTELAVRSLKNKNGEILLKGFRDHDVHEVLENSHIHHIKFSDSTGKEWFKIDLQTALKAIEAVKKNYPNLSNSKTDRVVPIVLRPEQEEAVEKTMKQFKKNDRMLWNAKMRFGKTVSALEVIKRSDFGKTIIITHRPVVDAGWYEDFQKIFYNTDEYIYGSKSTGTTIEFLINSGKKFVYFASIQDLRGSSKVGGKYDKNNAVFSLNWDFVIVDEAHEGTKTVLGDDVIKNLVKENNGYTTKFLALSGTPFNILKEYEDNIYTWDYVMEQENKARWNIEHFGDSNPYEELPEMKIFTYDLGKILTDKSYMEIEDKAFNFREFFRVWTGDIKYDYKPMPSECSIGDFVHEEDVLSFLNLITKDDSESRYPYSNERYRRLFQHSLWMVPGVKEAKALSKLLKSHPVFGCGAFDIVNVAGEGDEEERPEEALKKVKRAIKNADDGYTITLSCGRLTTGVTIPEWTAVLMLSGSFSTSASNYLQTIFRVQSPCNKDGKYKNYCYVFDFAPDRTLKMVSEAVALSTKAGKATASDRAAMGEFLNYCPVISIDGTIMKNYDTGRLLQQLKRAYADRAVKNGFDDTKLYNDELLKLDKIALEDFADLKRIIGSSKSQSKTKDIEINNQGFTDEEYEEIQRIERKPKKERTPEELAKLEEKKENLKNQQSAISILRGISIRMPLLIYGADIPFEDDFTIEKFLDDNTIDNQSWEEFMPKGVTKDTFKKFIKYYDPEIFIAAGRKIRNIAKSADELPPTERVQKIAELFNSFKNPDKETVLTPWRVVNMHMSDCLGGYDFFDEKHKNPIKEPRFVNQGQVTQDTLANTNAQILEINSKTGLYPLYVTYSIYREKCKKYKNSEMSLELQRNVWNDTIKNNVFVICKTPMAKQITQRTLGGYSDVKINAHYFDDLINQLKNKSQQFIERVLKTSYWKKGDDGQMKFDAIVGNPPYQEETSTQISQTNGQSPRKNIFQYFQMISDKISSGYVSLIYPGARWIHRSGKGMKDFGLKQINDPALEKLIFFPNSKDVFTDVGIADGISIVLKNNKKNTNGFNYVYIENSKIISIDIDNPGTELLTLNPQNAIIVKKVSEFVYKNNYAYLHERILPRTLFGIESNFVEENPHLVKIYTSDNDVDFNTEVKLFANDKAGKAGRSMWFVTSKNNIPSGNEYIDDWKVVVSSANAGGQKRDNQLAIIDNHSVFGRSRVALGIFKTELEAINFYNYCQTNLIKFMFLMTDESLTSLGKKVPDILDYTDTSILDFSKDLNSQLYELNKLTKDEIAFIEETIKPME